MPYLLNSIYIVLLVLCTPWLLWKMLWTGKYRRGIWLRMKGQTPIVLDVRRRIWLHGVSVGEILLLKPLIARLQLYHPEWELVLSTTTSTGFDVAKQQFPNLTVFYFPLDFTWAVDEALQN